MTSLQDYKLGRGCENPNTCPWPTDRLTASMLDFHHVPGVTKTYRTCAHTPPCTKSMQHVLKVWNAGDPDGELKRCQVLCSNCHREATFQVTA